MSELLDARGLACPAPVLMTKDAVENTRLSVVEVLVDNEAAQENVSRFLTSRQFLVTAFRDGDDYKISARRPDGAPENAAGSEPLTKAEPDTEKKIMVMIPTDRLGFGDDELGKKLIISFVKTIKEMGKELWRLVLVNNGVKLAIGGSPVLADLMNYEKEGLTILVCGTCLTHFGLLDAKKVGETTNMLDIVTAMQLADKVITV